ncbi:MAG: hypothetical protein HY783_01345, partial [Chloroflexi bacterium]|nr:hypothetical protein [Chloroflexota bacterium]
MSNLQKVLRIIVLVTFLGTLGVACGPTPIPTPAPPTPTKPPPPPPTATPVPAIELALTCRCVEGGVNANMVKWFKTYVAPKFAE